MVFVIVRFPGIWNTLNSKSASGRGNLSIPTGAALIVAGLAMITTPLWAGPSHMIEDRNLVMTFEIPLVVDGIALIVIGTGLVFVKRLLAMVRTRRLHRGHLKTQISA